MQAVSFLGRVRVKLVVSVQYQTLPLPAMCITSTLMDIPQVDHARVMQD
jgi:hypothetical protein